MRSGGRAGARERRVMLPEATSTRSGPRISREKRSLPKGFAAIPVLGGFRGLTLWIPFSNEPSYDVLAPWPRAFASALAAQHPNALSVAPHVAERGNRVMLGAKTNHGSLAAIVWPKRQAIARRLNGCTYF